MDFDFNSPPGKNKRTYIMREETKTSLTKNVATVSHLPSFSGDGYGWGGSAVLTIGGRSILLGESSSDNELAWEIANRWNAALPTTEIIRKPNVNKG